MKPKIKLIQTAVVIALTSVALGGANPLHATQGAPQEPSSEAPLPLPTEPPTEGNDLLPGPNDIENAPDPFEELTPDGYDPTEWWDAYEYWLWLFGLEGANEMWEETAPSEPEPEPTEPAPPADNVPPGAKEAE